MSSDDIIAEVSAQRGHVQYQGQWWRIDGIVSGGGERQYLLSRDGESARVPASAIPAVLVEVKLLP